MSEPKPTAPRGDSAAAGRKLEAVGKKVLGVAALVFAWRFLTRQPPQLSADLLQGLLIAGVGALVMSMIAGLFADMRGKDGMDKLGTAGTWVANVLACLIAVALIWGLFTVVEYIAGPTIVQLLRQLGLIS